jgi:hypothetical protein
MQEIELELLKTSKIDEGMVRQAVVCSVNGRLENFIVTERLDFTYILTMPVKCKSNILNSKAIEKI